MAAVAAGAGLEAVGGMMAATNANDAAQGEMCDAEAASGRPTLVVSTTGPHERALVEGAMRQAGATQINSVRRAGAAIFGRAAAP